MVNDEKHSSERQQSHSGASELSKSRVAAVREAGAVRQWPANCGKYRTGAVGRRPVLNGDAPSARCARGVQRRGY